MDMEIKKTEILTKLSYSFIATVLIYFLSIVVQLYGVTIGIQTLNYVGFFESDLAELTLFQSYLLTFIIPVGIMTIFFIVYFIFYKKMRKKIERDDYNVNSNIILCTLSSIVCAGLFGPIVNLSIFITTSLECNEIRYLQNKNKFNAPNVAREIDIPTRAKNVFLLFTVTFILYIVFATINNYLGLWDLLFTLAVLVFAVYNIKAIYNKLLSSNVNVSLNLLLASLALIFANATFFSFVLIICTYFVLSPIYKLRTLDELGFKPGYIPISK